MLPGLSRTPLRKVPDMADSKRCSRCETWFPVTGFARQVARLDGLYPWCRACQRAYNQEYRDDPVNRARRKARRQASPEPYDRTRRVQYMYDVDLAVLLAAQDGRCAVCGTADPGGRWSTWHIDHDSACCAGKRSCGKCVRGILCSNCNLMLGHAKDSPERLRAAADYIEQRRHSAAIAAPSPRRKCHD